MSMWYDVSIYKQKQFWNSYKLAPLLDTELKVLHNTIDMKIAIKEHGNQVLCEMCMQDKNCTLTL